MSGRKIMTVCMKIVASTAPCIHSSEFQGLRGPHAQEYGRYFGMKVGVLRGGCLTGPSHSGVELHAFCRYLVRSRSAAHLLGIWLQRKAGSRQYSQPRRGRAIEEFAAIRAGEVYNMAAGRETASPCSKPSPNRGTERQKNSTGNTSKKTQGRPHLLHLKSRQIPLPLPKLVHHHQPRLRSIARSLANQRTSCLREHGRSKRVRIRVGPVGLPRLSHELANRIRRLAYQISSSEPEYD